MDNGAALVVGGGGRVSHLVIPEPAIDYPSFLCLSARPVKSAGVTQTNRSVFQSVLSREYLSAARLFEACPGIEEQPLALFCSFAPAGQPCQEGNRPHDLHQLIGSTSKLASSNGVAAERRNFGFGLAPTVWSPGGVLWQGEHFGRLGALARAPGPWVGGSRRAPLSNRTTNDASISTNTVVLQGKSTAEVGKIDI